MKRLKKIPNLEEDHIEVVFWKKYFKNNDIHDEFFNKSIEDTFVRS